MARSALQRRSAAPKAAPHTAPAATRPDAQAPARPAWSEPDAALHHRIRLGVVSALAGTRSLTFNELKAVLDTTDGNLSVHARKLEDAGYILCSKRFDERRPRTEYRLAASGRRALQRYLDHMEALIAAARHTLQD